MEQKKSDHIGQPLPDLNVQTSEGKTTTVQAHLSQQNTLLYFLHGTWRPDCVSSFTVFSDASADCSRRAKSAVVVRDKPETLAAFLLSAQPRLEYTVHDAAFSKSASVGRRVARTDACDFKRRLAGRQLDRQGHPAA